MSFVEIHRGDGPILLGIPHTGTEVPADILEGFNARGRALEDTDWHIHNLYSNLLDGITTVRTRIHRYVIDANRDPSGASLYPGQNTTGLCTLTDFEGQPIYLEGHEPDANEVKARRVAFHAPYHAALEAELDRIRGLHGFAILYDCHSIRSRIAFLFDGTLPDFNIGTNCGATCAPEIEAAVEKICAVAGEGSSVLNGRFKGGWTTRHYGRPDEGLHTIQMELAQSTFLSAEAPPYAYDPARADILRSHLKPFLTTLADWRPI